MSVKLKAKILLGSMMLTPIFGFTNAVPEVSAVTPGLEQKFNNAVSIGNVETVRALLDEGLDVNMDLGSRQTALHIAVEKGNLEMVELLLDRGANVNAINIDGNIALEIAVEKGNIGMVELLLKYEAVPGTIAPVDTALDTAVEQGYVEIVKLLLDHSSGRFVLSDNALRIAVEKGYVGMVELLLDRGANVNAKFIGGETALHIAVKNNDVEMVELLLNKGADVNIIGEYGKTALRIAVEKGYVKIVGLLSERFALNDNALEIAVEKGDTSTVKELLKLGLKPSLKLVRVVFDRFDRQDIALELLNQFDASDVLNRRVPYLLEFAVEWNACKVVEKLLELGLKPSSELVKKVITDGKVDIALAMLNKLDEDTINELKKYHDLLDVASRKCNGEVVDKLLVLNVGDFDVRLSVAIDRNQQEVAFRILDDHFNEIKEKSSCLLYTAAHNNMFWAVEKLLQLGVDPTYKDQCGHTALSYAIKHNNEAAASRILGVLTAKGVGVDFDCLVVAARCGIVWAIDLLENKVDFSATAKDRNGKNCSVVRLAILSQHFAFAKKILDKLGEEDISKLKTIDTVLGKNFGWWFYCPPDLIKRLYPES